MVLTWMIFSSVGITIARYMKPLLTDFFVRHKRTLLWFQVNKYLSYVTIHVYLAHAENMWAKNNYCCSWFVAVI